MQQQLDMEAQPRPERGKNAARRLRAAGKVPAVLYGLSKESIAVSLDAKEITKLLQSPSGHNQIVNLKVSGGGAESAMAVDWLVDPVRGNLLHVDMLRVDLQVPVEVEVSIEVTGVSRGTREQGGHDEIVNREVSLRALPLDVPAKIVVNVADIGLGAAIRVADLPASEKYEYLSPADMLIMHCVSPKVADETKGEGEEAVGEAAKPAETEKGSD